MLFGRLFGASSKPQHEKDGPNTGSHEGRANPKKEGPTPTPRRNGQPSISRRTGQSPTNSHPENAGPTFIPKDQPPRRANLHSKKEWRTLKTRKEGPTTTKERRARAKIQPRKGIVKTHTPRRKGQLPRGRTKGQLPRRKGQPPHQRDRTNSHPKKDRPTQPPRRKGQPPTKKEWPNTNSENGEPTHSEKSGPAITPRAKSKKGQQPP